MHMEMRERSRFKDTAEQFSLILSTYVHMFENNKKAADLGNPISATRPWPNFVTSKPSPAPLEP